MQPGDQKLALGHRHPISCVALSPSGQYLATGEEVEQASDFRLSFQAIWTGVFCAKKGVNFRLRLLVSTQFSGRTGSACGSDRMGDPRLDPGLWSLSFYDHHLMIIYIITQVDPKYLVAKVFVIIFFIWLNHYHPGMDPEVRIFLWQQLFFLVCLYLLRWGLSLIIFIVIRCDDNYHYIIVFNRCNDIIIFNHFYLYPQRW